LRRAQWLDHEKLKEVQERKLRSLLNHAYATVPYYRRLFDAAGVRPHDVRTTDDLSCLPITTRSSWQSQSDSDRLSTSWPADSLESEHTSGSTGRPFTVYSDPRFMSVRTALFWRALRATGYRPGQRVLLLTTRRGNRVRRSLRWRYVSIEEPPDVLLAILNDYRPHVLYGCLSPLRLLARHVTHNGLNVHRPQVVISTAETLDPTSRRTLGRVFNAEVFDIYGLTETGVVAWECPFHDGYHVAEDTCLVEFVGSETDGAESSLVLTNLDLHAMPYIRFQTGDLVVAGSTSRCRCGRSLRRLERVEGRMLDSVTLPNGRVISPYRLIHALGHLAELERYQVVQEAVDRFTVRIEDRSGHVRDIAERARSAVLGVVGATAHVRVVPEANLDPPAGVKYKLVRSEFSAEPHLVC
jgi:phenylacetate-CoA ligase